MKEIKNWEKATQELVNIFAKKYYTCEDENRRYFNVDMYWVGDEIGDILYIEDDYYNLDRILQALKFNATFEQLRDFQEYEIYCLNKKKDKKINFKNFVKLNLKLEGLINE